MTNKRNNLNKIQYTTKVSIASNKLSDSSELYAVARRVVEGDTEYMGELMAESVRLQRYVVMVLMKLTENMESRAADDVMSLYLVVWGVYRQIPACCGREITPEQFDRVQKHNISMLRYLEGEEDEEQFAGIVRNDRQGDVSHAVMQFVADGMQDWPSLAALD